MHFLYICDLVIFNQNVVTQF